MSTDASNSEDQNQTRPKRSKNGCWTCKTRKKKCDETGPPCGRCLTSKIECLGYGPKPDWLQRKSNPKHKRPKPEVAQAPEVSDQGPMASLVTVAQTAAATAATYNRRKDHEADLLLHYLEKVFPLQWQYYKGPNTWILPLLSQSRAIYHSVLSISAIHKAVQNANSNYVNDEDLQLHHRLTLQELRNSISVDKNQTKMAHSLAAVIMLISFELFQGGRENWQHHIDAGITLVSLITNGGSRPCTTEAEKFLVTCSIWFDVLTCATIYTSCKSSQILDNLLVNSDMLPLDQLMGCRLDVLMQLNEVMKLYTWKVEQQNLSCLSLTDLVKKSREIEERLNDAFSNSEKVNSNPLTAQSVKLFALAILVCLYGIVSGYSPNLPEIMHAVDKSIPIFKGIPRQYYRGLVFPICVLGSMAREEYHSYFMSLFGDDPHQLAFGNFAQTRKIMSHTWALRSQRNTPFVHWVDAMNDLNLPLLLV